MESTRRWYWRTIGLGAAVGLAVGLVFSFGWHLGSLQFNYAHRAEDASQQYAGHTKERIERECPIADPERLLECVQQIVEASRESQRGEYDLSAQESMSEWTLWLLITSIVTFPIT